MDARTYVLCAILIVFIWIGFAANRIHAKSNFNDQKSIRIFENGQVSVNLTFHEGEKYQQFATMTAYGKVTIIKPVTQLLPIYHLRDFLFQVLSN